MKPIKYPSRPTAEKPTRISGTHAATVIKALFKKKKA